MCDTAYCLLDVHCTVFTFFDNLMLFHIHLSTNALTVSMNKYVLWLWLWTGNVLTMTSTEVCMCVSMCRSLTFSGSRYWPRAGQLRLQVSCVNASFFSHSTLVVCLMAVCPTSRYRLCCLFTRLIKNASSLVLPLR